MKIKGIEKVVYANEHAMGKLRVKQPLPSQNIDYLDPFVLLHHAKSWVTDDYAQKHQGVDPHPHRGFAPVTFVFEGGVEHRDSRGNKQSVYSGGVQWMNAGMGIVHSERPAMAGTQEIIQMWVNVPAKNKMDQPTYYPFNKEQLPTYQGEQIEMAVVSGELKSLKGPVPTYTDINSAMIRGQKGSTLALDIPDHHHTFLYILDGKIRLGNQVIEKHHMVVFAQDGEHIELKLEEDSKALLMSGTPIKESMVAQGPFVLNNETEIMEAYRDYRIGKMGVLIED
ncbi:pirin family protein [Dyadobacter tibetensis]|uniref:pirin family protein n=1 Tax=Dyadobacter tibetensis TaxID=1211851 RepID=UPI00046EE07D|nr:pirin family protein [Dyadobacter tibetensis]